MLQDNPLLQQLKAQIREALPTQEGTIKATERGFGFLETDGGKSIFVPPPYMKRICHGDKVRAVIRTETEKDRQTAEPEALLEPALERFIGRICLQKNKLAVKVDHPLQNQRLPAKAAPGARSEQSSPWQDGDWVVASLKRHALRDGQFSAEIEQRIALADDPFAPWQVALAQHQLPADEPISDQSWSLADEASLQRQDLTALPFFTIDGEHTRDMDDALQIEQTDDGWQLTVAIADPSAYVAADSRADQEARKRGFTVYLPGRNIPMLPRQLADELCSLQAQQKRPVLCCRIAINSSGQITSESEFFTAWICSQAKLSYNQVSDYLEDSGSWQPEAGIASQLKLLELATQARIRWRESHEVMFADQPDYSFQLDSQGQVIAVHCQQRRIGHRLVEEAMVAANHQAGRLLARELGSGIFNVHPGFADEKLETVSELLKSSEITVSDELLTTLNGYCQLRRQIEQQESPQLDLRLRRLLAPGEMSAMPAEHFGMGLDSYATWTSPIRKYGDLINHRLIKQLLAKKAMTEMSMPDSELAEHLAECRRRNRRVERAVADWLYCSYYTENTTRDQQHDAEVTDINRGGMRVRLIETGAQVFIPAGNICPQRKRIKCQPELGMLQLDGKPLYHLGDKLSVHLVEINQQNRSLVAKPA